jgi:hypothetical protein
MDEVGISNVQAKIKILGLKVEKKVATFSSWERGKHIIVCICIGTSGILVHSILIFHG